MTTHATVAPTATPDPAGPLSVEEAILASFVPETRHDPYPAYEVLREAGPFVPGPFSLQIVSRYAEADAILQDSAWSHANEPAFLHPDSDGSDLPASFLWMEPPDHTRLRRLVTKAFTARGLESLRPRVEEVAREIVDDAIRAGETDVVEHVAYPLPLTMIAELIGVPPEDHASVRAMSAGIARGLDPDTLLTPKELQARVDGAAHFRDYFEKLVAERRARPKDDLVTALAQVEAEGDRLSTGEMIATLTVLLVAGHETTVNLLANGVLSLARNPDQFALLRANPELALPAVDELMRYDGPSHATTRMAVKDMEIAGHSFKEGDGVLILLASANRDPRAFDTPERLDLTRYAQSASVPRHLGFGVGLHYCIGAPLVRLEMECMLRELARRAPVMTLLADPPPYRPNIVVRGIAELPVRFEV
ncbi:cytochrome P450 [Frankia sp. CNm7]|uniref:Cytochrome P450 n=1 Tax=Frankia nepalensis TaxID=1836974 RepID=A0A937RCH2_9ACTN|nr:cytochrome P450 [Frankia nepalensis]MBL7500521.1 cytochrome P450 [Frankia nepalensis]MBL7509785.1 cytochrome P450 [Frankia nepalensis]MBL7522198.1 cytochrome P450 [Frankia nepalensis]MBL7627905.1 cytochrome P450 [Frankia nepalensis]